MPRDMSGMGRYPPQPRYQPFAFYTAVRMGDPEMLSHIMRVGVLCFAWGWCSPGLIGAKSGTGDSRGRFSTGSRTAAVVYVHAAASDVLPSRAISASPSLLLPQQSDPYFFTQDNGAGAPLHFAVTYRQLDMVRAGWYPACALLGCCFCFGRHSHTVWLNATL